MREEEEADHKRRVVAMLGAVAQAGKLASSIIPALLTLSKRALNLHAPERHEVTENSPELVAAIALVVNGLMVIEDHPEKLSGEKLLEIAKAVKRALEETETITKKTPPEDVKALLEKERLKRAPGKKAEELISDEELLKMFNMDQE